MDSLKDKSDLNLAAAELLYQESIYPAVVHCAYYSCVQLMKYICLNSIGKSEDDLRDLSIQLKQGSHEVLINQLKLYINSKSMNDRVFYRDILALKRLRVKSDYGIEQINEKESNVSITLSKSLLALLMNCI